MGLNIVPEGRVRKAVCRESGPHGLERGKGRKSLPIATGSDYQTIGEAEKGLEEYFQFYNHDRLHQSLDYQTPAQVYYRI